MKLLLIAAARSIHTIRWANALADAGIDVHLVSQYSPIESLDSRVALRRLPHILGIGYIFNGPRLRRLIEDIQPDIVNAHYATGAGTLARWVPNVPYVLNVWGKDVYEFPDKSPLHRRLIRGNLKRADVVASTSHVMAGRVRTLCPAIGHVQITPFGVDTRRFYLSEGAGRDPNRGGGKLVIGTVKTLAPKYGVDILLRAFRGLLDRIPYAASNVSSRLELRIVGDGPARRSLTNLAEELSIADMTTFVGRVPHEKVPTELARLDIFCALSRSESESFGVAVIEASAAALPVVVSNAGGLPEVVIDGQTGFVVPIDDPDVAADALAKLVRSRELRAAIGRAGAQHVAQNYEWSACVERMIALFNETLSKRRGRQYSQAYTNTDTGLGVAPSRRA